MTSYDKTQEILLENIKILTTKTDAFDVKYRTTHTEHRVHALHYSNRKWYCQHLISARNRKFKNEVTELLNNILRRGDK